MKILNVTYKKALVILLTALLVVSTFLPSPVTVKAYTSTTADVAMDAFQNYCYISTRADMRNMTVIIGIIRRCGLFLMI
ncbi:MAG: hypothetical protein K0S04_3603 [Herbinix sp.]|nr:hypothetical protein [Herbinix sp.]